MKEWAAVAAILLPIVIVSHASVAVFLLGLGEELWKKFLPKYLEHLGAGPGVIGLFCTAEDFFDAVYRFEKYGWGYEQVYAEMKQYDFYTSCRTHFSSARVARKLSTVCPRNNV